MLKINLKTKKLKKKLKKITKIKIKTKEIQPNLA